MNRWIRLRHVLGWWAAVLLFLPMPACALTWQIEVADPRHDAIYTSLALDSQDRPHISAFDWGAGVLTYTRFDGTAWRTEVVDGRPGDMAGAPSTLAIDSQDRPHISYVYWSYDPPAYSLRYARYDGTAWRIETVDALSYSVYTSLALDRQGRPHISYGGGISRVLKYARFDGTTWRIETVDSGVLGHTSLKLDAHGRPHISYSGRQRLRYARFDGTTWQLETVDDLGPFLVESTSLVLDGEGRPHIAYSGLKYARWDGTRWRIEVADPRGGNYISLGLDSANRPVISSHNIDFQPSPPVESLRLARFDGLGWRIETVDSGAVGAYSSLKLDAQDRVHISYTSDSPGALKYARGTPEVRLDLQLNQPSFRAGETLSLSVTVTPYFPWLQADAYLALLLPDGPLLFLQGDGGQVEGPQPLVRDWPVTAVSGELFRYTFTGAEPPGTYTWFAALTEPRTLSLFTPLLILPFTFTP